MISWISGSKKNLFNAVSWYRDDHSIFLQNLDSLRNEEEGASALHKKNDVLFSLAWNMMFTDNSCILVLNSLEMKNRVFLSQKVDGNVIYPDYWKFFVLIFSGMTNTAFFEPKSCWKDDIYWLLESFYFNLFGDGKHGLFLSQKVDGKLIFTDYWKVLVLIFSGMGNTVFFESKG